MTLRERMPMSCEVHRNYCAPQNARPVFRETAAYRILGVATVRHRNTMVIN